MRKKVLIVILAIVLNLSIFEVITAKAHDNNISSYGSIEFKRTDAEKVAIYAEDINYLLGEINKLKSEIK